MSLDLPKERAFALAAKIQSARGADAAPTMADDAIRLASSFEVTTDWVSRNEAEGEQTGGKGTFPSGSKDGRIHRYPIRRRMRGPGTAYSGVNLPEEDALLMAILGTRNVDTTGGSEKVEYSGADEGEALLTVLGQTLAREFKALDCVPMSASIEWEAGKFIELAVELAGVGIAPTQQALQAATLDSVIAPSMKGATFTLDGVALTPIKGSLDLGLEISEPILDGSAGDAWAGYVITDRKPTGTMEVQITDQATFNPYALAAASTLMPWVFHLGGAQYNNPGIEADRLEIKDVREVNRGGLKAWSLDFAIHRATSPSVKDPVILFQ